MYSWNQSSVKRRLPCIWNLAVVEIKRTNMYMLYGYVWF
jgi:hypothetical protein